MADSFRESIEFLYSLMRHGIKLGLDPTIQMLNRLGKPHQRYVILHIGGTNGKGSCAAMTAAILRASGYRVGLYTSPHLVEFPERIRVQDHCIPHERVVELTAHLRRMTGSTLTLTFFEFTTCMAFQYFAEEQVDVAVIEVGMGGRFDATNVVDPIGVLITNVGIDHEQYLGHTHPEIAFEKAGIVKQEVPVVFGPMSSESEQVIRDCAIQRQAPYYQLHSDFQVTKHPPHFFQYSGMWGQHAHLTCSLVGDHQLDNAACALALLEVGNRRGLTVSESAIHEGLSTVAWEGRLETLAEDPWLLVDGAHNPTAGKVLASFLKQKLHDRMHARLILIIGMMKDKNHNAFLETLVPLADHLILTEASMPRAASVRDLQQALPNTSVPVALVPNPIEALERAREHATPSDLICMTGSLILVGEVKGSILGRDCAPLRV